MTARPRETGPVQVTGEVLAIKKVGAYHHLTLVAPGVAERSGPAPSSPSPSAGESRLRLRRRASGPPGPADRRLRRHRRAASSRPSAPGTALAGRRSRPAPGSTSSARSAGPSRCPRSRSACVLVGEGCAERAAVPARRAAARARLRRAHAARRRPDEAAPALGARGPPRRPRGHGRHRGRLGRPARARSPTRSPDVLTRAEADVVYAAGPRRRLHARRRGRRGARRLEPDRASTCR